MHGRGRTFSSSPAQSTVASGHSPHGNSSTSSPTVGSNSWTGLVVAQVYLLLGTIKEDKDRTKWESQAEQLRKLVDEHGMDVFPKYFTRLVVGNAPKIFPGFNRAVANPGNYQLLVDEVRKISKDVEQAGRIAESIETANEDLFRDFDLSTFMEHFKMDAIEKTILALAFKTGSRTDLKTKADAILSVNFQQLISNLYLANSNSHNDLTDTFIATIVDRFIQFHHPGFSEKAQQDFVHAIRVRFDPQEPFPTEVSAALYLSTILIPRNQLALYIKRIGSAFTSDEESCVRHLRNIGNIRLDEEQVGAALLYSVISREPRFSTSALVSSLRRVVPQGFQWQEILNEFDKPELRITSEMLLSLYNALRPLAVIEGEEHIDIEGMWGGLWRNSETQISFMTAYASLSPEQLDATTIPGLTPSFTSDLYVDSSPGVIECVKRAVRHPLVSHAFVQAVVGVALPSHQASDTQEARRLFQKVVIPELAIFLVSASTVAKPWPDTATETVNSLFEHFIYKKEENYDFVLDSFWRQDKIYVIHRLAEAHAKEPLELPIILEHAMRHNWLDELVTGLSGFSLDLAAFAHAHGHLDLDRWQMMHAAHYSVLANQLLRFLEIKANHELEAKEQGISQQQSVMLPVKTISALLRIFTDIQPRDQLENSMSVQRQCITAYPRLINYGEGYDEIIDANGAERNSLPKEANDKMEEHYKRMYNEEIKVVTVLESLQQYKHSQNPMDQDVFACMIHGLFDEYSLYNTYPLEALKTTALLFGGIICYKLLPILPLEIGLGMILDAVRMNEPDAAMYKFGLEALKQTLELFGQWPGLCRQLIQIPQLRGTDAYARADEVAREHNAEIARNGNGEMRPDGIDPDTAVNGNFDDMLATGLLAPPFVSVNADLVPHGDYEDPPSDTQEKVLFVLNNVTERNLDSKFDELRDVMDEKYQPWFAGHLVEERAKMQPNYHHLYLELIKLFGNKKLWAEVLRETYVSVVRVINAEATMQPSSPERIHLKNLGIWLGSLTLARDKPIKHRNIAFKQLLLEAYDSQRLVVVLPFVCKVLSKAVESSVFKPPNPWLMDIIFLLVELYHDADLKLNLRFEIELLCNTFKIDWETIRRSTDFQTRLPPVEEPIESMAADAVDRFDNLSLNGMGGSVGTGRFSPHEITSSIPDLGPLLQFPPSNDLIDQAQLHAIVRGAVTRAVHEIIAPVVERSVTIAAISTAQMIHKDFATEPDEDRLRSAATSMVKRTAGSLALVTSKEPLRASMTNYIRSMASDLRHGLPEGTIIMCVNSNLDMACSLVEKKAEERAIPEIEEMIAPELEARRQQRARRPNEPYVDPALSRWAMTIPNPYKLLPGTPGGLNQEQMAIYDEFARQPRILSLGGSGHGTSSSDSTRAMANDILQDQYPSISNIPAPAESNVLPHLNMQRAYAQPPAPMTNGRLAQMDPDTLAEHINGLIGRLVDSASSTSEQRFADLPRPHPISETLDQLHTLVIRNTNAQGEAARYTAEKICERMFSGLEDSLAIEVLMHSLGELSKISPAVLKPVVMIIATQPDESLINVPLVIALMTNDLLEWQRVDLAVSKGLAQHKEAALEFLSILMHQVLLNDRPMALRTDFARSLETLAQWIREEPDLEAGHQLVLDLSSRGLPASFDAGNSQMDAIRDQMEYTFDEWIHLCSNSNATDVAYVAFIDQLHNKQLLNDADSSCVFFRLCIDICVDRFELQVQNTGFTVDAYQPTDALAKLIARLVKQQGERHGEVKTNKAAYLDSVLSLVSLVLNHHYVMRGETYNQKIFFRLFSSILSEFNTFIDLFVMQEKHDILNVFAKTLLLLEPSRFPGFVFPWLALISHRNFLPKLLRLPSQNGWESLVQIVEKLMLFIGELTKPLHPSMVTRDIYQGAMKLLVALNHDFPEFLAGNHVRLCAAVPINCVQLQNLILTASPSTFSKMSDPLQQGLKVDRADEIRQSPPIPDVEEPLQDAGLKDLIDQALQSGPSEDAVAHIAHAVHRRNGNRTTIGYLPVNVNVDLIDAIVLYIGEYAVGKASQKGGANFVQASPDAALLTMLVHELSSEARYYFLNSIVNQLRYTNAHTHYFNQALLEIFGSDTNDLEELELRGQIVRIILERSIGQWPQPWGLVLFVAELIKNEKYKFFDLPFIAASPHIRDQFASLAQLQRM